MLKGNDKRMSAIYMFLIDVCHDRITRNEYELVLMYIIKIKYSLLKNSLGYANSCSERSDTFMGAWNRYLRYLGCDRFIMLYCFNIASSCHCTRSLLGYY